MPEPYCNGQEGQHDHRDLAQFHPYIKTDERGHEGIIRHAEIAQHTGKSQAVEQAEAEYDEQSAFVQFPGQNILNADIGNR